MTESLLVMRLIDMRKIHPAQDNSRVCSECGHRVGIYPSGQRALKKDPELTILCSRCAEDGRWIGRPAAASAAEFWGELRDSEDVKKA